MVAVPKYRECGEIETAGRPVKTFLPIDRVQFEWHTQLEAGLLGLLAVAPSRHPHRKLGVHRHDVGCSHEASIRGCQFSKGRRNPD